MSEEAPVAVLTRGAVAPPTPAAVIEHLTTAVLLLDRELRLRELNPAAEALLAASASRVRGARLEAALPGLAAYADAFRHVLEAGQAFAERELSLVRAGGGSITVDCLVTPVGGGVPPSWVLVELVHLDRHRQITREERLLAQNESARALVRRLAHEIKNPLGGLRGAAQLLERELPEPALYEYTRVIIREADRLQKLVDRMLGPRTPPHMRTVNVHEVTERVRTLLRAEAPPGVAIERDYDPSIPEFTADPELLIQAMLNIARNAVQAVEGRGRIRIRTRIHRQVPIGQRQHRLVCRIDVSDDGPGIPEDLAESVFYPMVSGRGDGTGLGLSIAQSLVYQHGGLIECTSRPGDTTFSILLPVENGHEESERP